MAFTVRAMRAISSLPPVGATRWERSDAAMASTRRRIDSTGASARPIPIQIRPPVINNSSGNEMTRLAMSTLDAVRDALAVDEAEDQPGTAFGEDRADLAGTDLGQRRLACRAYARSLTPSPLLDVSASKVSWARIGAVGDRRTGGPDLRPGEIGDLDDDVAVHGQDHSVVLRPTWPCTKRSWVRTISPWISLLASVASELRTRCTSASAGETEDRGDRDHEDDRQARADRESVQQVHQSVRTL